MCPWMVYKSRIFLYRDDTHNKIRLTVHVEPEHLYAYQLVNFSLWMAQKCKKTCATNPPPFLHLVLFISVASLWDVPSLAGDRVRSPLTFCSPRSTEKPSPSNSRSPFHFWRRGLPPLSSWVRQSLSLIGRTLCGSLRRRFQSCIEFE